MINENLCSVSILLGNKDSAVEALETCLHDDIQAATDYVNHFLFETGSVKRVYLLRADDEKREFKSAVEVSEFLLSSSKRAFHFVKEAGCSILQNDDAVFLRVHDGF